MLSKTVKYENCSKHTFVKCIPTSMARTSLGPLRFVLDVKFEPLRVNYNARLGGKW